MAQTTCSESQYQNKIISIGTGGGCAVGSGGDIGSGVGGGSGLGGGVGYVCVDVNIMVVLVLVVSVICGCCNSCGGCVGTGFVGSSFDGGEG